jgi:hypothetical protein
VLDDVFDGCVRSKLPERVSIRLKSYTGRANPAGHAFFSDGKG